MENNHQEKDVGLYEKLLSRTRELIDSGRKGLDEALRKAEEEMTAAGEYTREQAEKISEYVRRDLEEMEKNARRAGKAIRKAVDPKRVEGRMKNGLARLLRAVADAAARLAERAEKQVEYRTGEVTAAGTLACRACGAEMTLKQPGRIPPCPKCYKTRFMRVG